MISRIAALRGVYWGFSFIVYHSFRLGTWCWERGVPPEQGLDRLLEASETSVAYRSLLFGHIL